VQAPFCPMTSDASPAYAWPEAEPCCTLSPVRDRARPERKAPYPTAFAIYPGDCYATRNFLAQGFRRTRDCR
jgi:hypothetical protein